ncbi:putative transposase [Rhodovulum sp. ES.010]|uniref:Mu transposase C-terminal domain-containing protein n=1 Tax=Rhodovulum sp. ES.010 TaxID=1882821 RepID=UPI000928A5C3|nr:DDE-type integrase/transposase/recombinase [Rhodovulum sp. ES.010]SIO39365.1 putative transposase [Rhodovulum sp. ES.010]
MSLDFDRRFPRFQIGREDRVTIDGQAFRLGYMMQDAYALVPAEGEGAAQVFEFGHLNRLNAAGKVRHEIEHFLPKELRTRRQPSGGTGSSLATLTPGQRARIDQRYALVEAFNEVRAEGVMQMTDASIEAHMDDICRRASAYLADQVDPELEWRKQQAAAGKGRKPKGGGTLQMVAPVHPTTLRRWVARVAKSGKAGLIDRFSNRGNRTSYFTAEENALLGKTVRESYLTLNRAPMSKTVTDVQRAFRKENADRLADGRPPLRVPSREAVRQCIKSFSRFEVLVSRYGEQEAMKRLRPVGRGLEVSRPFERVEIDEWKIDLVTIMAKAGMREYYTEEELKDLGLDDGKGRWWLVAAIDCRTKLIVGMTLTRNPKTSAAAQCLRMVVSDKGRFANAAGAQVAWNQFATPELLVSDNGAAFKSTAFTDTCATLDITLERTIAGLPGMRGHIERVFQTAATRLLPMLNGRTFGDVATRGDHPAEARACLDTEDLCYSLVRWIVDVYHNTPHEGLGVRTPLQQWESDLMDGNFPLRAAPEMRTKRCAFGLRLNRRLTREGLRVLGVRYHHEALAATVIEGGHKTVELRWDPEDLGAVEVVIDGQAHEARAVHDGFDGVDAHTWIAARRALRAKSASRKAWEEEVVFRALDDIEALNTRKQLQYGLVDKPITAERLKHLEESLFAGFHITGNTPKTRTPLDGVGRVIEPRAPEEEPQASIAQTPDAPRPARPRSSNSWTIRKPGSPG